mgnify:CR=1 FL=1
MCPSAVHPSPTAPLVTSTGEKYQDTGVTRAPFSVDTHLWIKLLMLLVIAIVLIGCSSDDDDEDRPTDPGGGDHQPLEGLGGLLRRRRGRPREQRADEEQGGETAGTEEATTPRRSGWASSPGPRTDGWW